jgi:hypothetical protein
MSDSLSIIITIFKNGLPGIPISFVFVYSTQFNDIITEIGIQIDFNGKLIIAIILSLLIGYLIQELWYLIFEIIPCIKHDSPRRKVLSIIEKKIVKKNPISESLKYKFRFNVDNSKKKWNKIYSIWEYILYSDKTDKEKVKRLKAYWNLFHSNMIIGLGFFIGAFVDLFLNCELTKDKNIFGLIFLFLFTLILFLKAISSRIIVDKLEENWAHTLIDEYLSNSTKLETIEKDDKTKSKS